MASVNPEEPDGGSPIGNLLCVSWELAQKILENLSYFEVSKLRLVCRTWADVGKMILAKRRPLHYFTYHPHCIPTTHGKVAIAETTPASLFEGFFMHVVSKPRYCLVFCNGDWLCRTDVFDHADGTDPMNVIEYLHKTLPLSCDLVMVSATGVIGTVEKSYQGHWVESAQSMNQEILDYIEDTEGRPQRKPSKKARKERVTKRAICEARNSNVGYSIGVEQNTPAMANADGVSLLLIPHHPGVKMQFFDISPVKFYSDFRGGQIPSDDLVISEGEFNDLLSLSPCEKLTSLLIFDTTYEEMFINAFLEAALSREDSKLALGGGVADAFQSGRTGRFVPTNDHIFGVAVSGPNIVAASVVIPESLSDPTHVPRYIMKLKACGLPEKQSVAFMFSCCGRGFHFWDRISSPTLKYENVEVDAFRKAFPNTPIFGFFGRGEIGITHLPVFPRPDGAAGEGVAPKRRRRWKGFHQFSTIIVLLSFL